MATPTCPKCDSTRFEVNTITPAKSNFKLQSTNCSSCGCIVGITEHFNIGALLDKIAKALNIRL